MMKAIRRWLIPVLIGAVVVSTSTAAEVPPKPNVQGTCGENITGKNGGDIASPGFPDSNYPPFSDCQYTVTAPPDNVVVPMGSFIDGEPLQCFDKILIYRTGNLSDTPDTYCGNSTIYPTASTGNKLIVQFQSDQDIAASGFVLNWYVLNPLNLNPVFDCDFDGPLGLCPGWSQSSSDGVDWIFARGPTPSRLTGPTADHTTGTDEGKYAYLEASQQQRGTTAVLLSPTLKLNEQPAYCLDMWYHSSGDGKGLINILQIFQNGEGSFLEVLDKVDPGWQNARIPLPTSELPLKIGIEAIRGRNYKSDVAIDDIRLLSENCENTNETDYEYVQDCSFFCNDGSCIPQSQVCDELADCSEGEDEADCQATGTSTTTVASSTTSQISTTVSQNCTANLVYMSCASACVHTCADGEIPPLCTFSCAPGCSCPIDFPILHEGRCITYQDCPATAAPPLSTTISSTSTQSTQTSTEPPPTTPPAPQCPANLVFNPCASECNRTCRDGDLPPTCTRQCVPRCACPQDVPIYHNERCVALVDCPALEAVTGVAAVGLTENSANVTFPLVNTPKSFRITISQASNPSVKSEINYPNNDPNKSGNIIVKLSNLIPATQYSVQIFSIRGTQEVPSEVLLFSTLPLPTEPPSTTTVRTTAATTATTSQTSTTKPVTTQSTLPTIMQEPCGPDNFTCDDGECIALIYKCDTFPDCADASDESDKNCPSPACVLGQFACREKCIPLAGRCNGTIECLDASDEFNCPTTATTTTSLPTKPATATQTSTATEATTRSTAATSATTTLTVTTATTARTTLQATTTESTTEITPTLGATGQPKCLQDMQNALALISTDPSVLSRLPQCSNDGLYRPQQCKTESNMCVCVVEETGQEIPGTAFLQGSAAPIDCASLTQCQIQFKNTAVFIHTNPTIVDGPTYPNCTKAGLFSPTQCNGLTGACWCVIPETGATIPQTEQRNGKLLDCSSLTKCQQTYLETGQQIALNPGAANAPTFPSCSQNGLFTRKQCNGFTNICQCVVEETGEIIPGTEKQDSNLNCSVLTNCQIEWHRMAQIISTIPVQHDIELPNCTTEGNYFPKQCTKQMDCWCVDPVTGRTVRGSGSLPGQGALLDCSGTTTTATTSTLQHTTTQKATTNTPVVSTVPPTTPTVSTSDTSSTPATDAPHKELCGSDMFTCDDGSCVLLSYKCDKYPDCLDGSDESKENCKEVCQLGQFACPEKCIPLSSRCNGTAECMDASDEFNCPPPLPVITPTATINTTTATETTASTEVPITTSAQLTSTTTPVFTMETSTEQAAVAAFIGCSEKVQNTAIMAATDPTVMDKIPSCDSNGLYMSQQCNAQTNVCWCVVKETGTIIPGTEFSQDTGPQLDCSNLSQCQKQFENTVKFLFNNPDIADGPSFPNCTSSGLFVPKQCNGMTGVCWCVIPETGDTIPKTESTDRQALNCSRLTKCQGEYMQTGQFIAANPTIQDGPTFPNCSAEGNFAPKQCNGFTNVCWCVLQHSGDVIPGTTKQDGFNLNCSELTACQQSYEDIGIFLSENQDLMDGPSYPGCNADGHFLPKQCDGFTGVCRCVVPETGETLPGTLLDGESGFNLNCTTLTKCQSLFLNTSQFIYNNPGLMDGPDLPDCTEDGFFAPRQCIGFNNVCWCVLPTSGDIIPGTQTQPGLGFGLNCSALTKCQQLYVNVGKFVFENPELAKGAVFPACAEDGMFVPLQCTTSGECRCVFPESGDEISGSLTPPGAQLDCSEFLNLEPPVTCGGIFRMESGSFTSPNYPNPYAIIDACEYSLMRNDTKQYIELTIEDMELGKLGPRGFCIEDRLEISSSGQSYSLCQSSPPSTPLQHSSDVTVRLIPGPQPNVYRGFSISYKIKYCDVPDQRFQSTSMCDSTCNDLVPVCPFILVQRCACPPERSVLHEGRCITADECPRLNTTLPQVDTTATTPEATTGQETSSHVQPDVTTQPETTTEPVATTQPDVTTQPDTTTQPDVTTQPDTTTPPVATTRPDVTTQPDTTQPDVTTQPDTTTQPVTTTQPDVTTQPEATTQTTQPDTTTQPVANTQPHITTQPETTTQTDATTQPEKNTQTDATTQSDAAAQTDAAALQNAPPETTVANYVLDIISLTTINTSSSRGCILMVGSPNIEKYFLDIYLTNQLDARLANFSFNRQQSKTMYELCVDKLTEGTSYTVVAWGSKGSITGASVSTSFETKSSQNTSTSPTMTPSASEQTTDSSVTGAPGIDPSTTAHASEAISPTTGTTSTQFIPDTTSSTESLSTTSSVISTEATVDSLNQGSTTDIGSGSWTESATATSTPSDPVGRSGDTFNSATTTATSDGLTTQQASSTATVSVTTDSGAVGPTETSHTSVADTTNGTTSSATTKEQTTGTVVLTETSRATVPPILDTTVPTETSQPTVAETTGSAVSTENTQAPIESSSATALATETSQGQIVTASSAAVSSETTQTQDITSSGGQITTETQPSATESTSAAASTESIQVSVATTSGPNPTESTQASVGETTGAVTLTETNQAPIQTTSDAAFATETTQAQTASTSGALPTETTGAVTLTETNQAPIQTTSDAAFATETTQAQTASTSGALPTETTGAVTVTETNQPTIQTTSDTAFATETTQAQTLTTSGITVSIETTKQTVAETTGAAVSIETSQAPTSHNPTESTQAPIGETTGTVTLTENIQVSIETTSDAATETTKAHTLTTSGITVSAETTQPTVVETTGAEISTETSQAPTGGTTGTVATENIQVSIETTSDSAFATQTSQAQTSTTAGVVSSETTGTVASTENIQVSIETTSSAAVTTESTPATNLVSTSKTNVTVAPGPETTGSAVSAETTQAPVASTTTVTVSDAVASTATTQADTTIADAVASAGTTSGRVLTSSGPTISTMVPSTAETLTTTQHTSPTTSDAPSTPGATTAETAPAATSSGPGITQQTTAASTTVPGTTHSATAASASTTPPYTLQIDIMPVTNDTVCVKVKHDSSADSYLITIDQTAIASNTGFSNNFGEVPATSPYTYKCFYDTLPGQNYVATVIPKKGGQTVGSPGTTNFTTIVQTTTAPTSGTKYKQTNATKQWQDNYNKWRNDTVNKWFQLASTYMTTFGSALPGISPDHSQCPAPYKPPCSVETRTFVDYNGCLFLICDTPLQGDFTQADVALWEKEYATYTNYLLPQWQKLYDAYIQASGK